MSAHISDELPRLLTGEANRETVLAAAEHLRTCVDCQHELISAVVAHASLTSAERFAPEIVSGLPPALFTDRSDDAQPASEPAGGSRERPGPALPDLSALFARVRAEAASSARPSRRRHLVAAAAAAVLIGGGATVYVATSDQGSHPNPSRTVRLAAFGVGTSPATATVTDTGTMKIDASALPHVAGKRYEVWLTNRARTAMQPVGWLGTNGTAAMTVPTDLMTRFSDIEVSVQPVAAKSYDYSGTSVLRGNYS